MKIGRKKNKNWLIKFTTFLEYVGFLVLINALFFVFYYHGLSLNFSFISLLFVLFFVLNYVLSLHLFKNRFLRIIIYVLAGLVITLSLANFAFFRVFGNFWRPSGGQFSQINQPFLNLLFSYYILVPTYLYFFAILFFAAVIVSSRWYTKRNEKNFRKFKLFKLSPDFLKLKNQKVIPAKVVIILFFIIVNCLFYFSLNIYERTMMKNNFTRERYFSDLGVYGYFYNQAAKFLLKDFSDFGQDGNLSTSQTTSTSKMIEKTDLDLLKQNLREINSLASNLDRPNYAVAASTTRPHVVIYQMESVDAWALKLDPSPMPFLKQLIDNNISTESFFSNSCITINTEFSSLCSFLPESNGPISDLFSRNNYYCLPSILKDNFGYQTSVYHANSDKFWNRGEVAPRWGFENLFFTPHYSLRENDADVLLDVVKKIKQADKPTFNYVIGFTSHGPHNQAFADYNLENNKLLITPYVAALPEFTKAIDQDEKTIRYYLGFLRAIDDGLKEFFKNLEKENLLDKTIVVVYGDHRYYNFFSDDKVSNYYNYNTVPFVVYAPKVGALRPAKIASQIDVAPTLLDLIAGQNYPKPNNFLGTSIFSSNHVDFAINKCLGQSYYVNQDLILFHDNFTNGNYSFACITESGKNNYEQYANLLTPIANSSDKIIQTNKLVSDISSENLITRLDNNISKSFQVNSETDFDHDGLSDLREKALETDPKNSDTDGDGFLDGVEVMFGWNPLSAESL
ncbi:MAG: sulfatase-like hydrolase/transferase [Candidatus Buchananbacteria bacterium]